MESRNVNFNSGIISGIVPLWKILLYSDPSCPFVSKISKCVETEYRIICQCIWVVVLLHIFLLYLTIKNWIAYVNFKFIAKCRKMAARMTNEQKKIYISMYKFAKEEKDITDVIIIYYIILRIFYIKIHDFFKNYIFSYFTKIKMIYLVQCWKWTKILVVEISLWNILSLSYLDFDIITLCCQILKQILNLHNIWKCQSHT